MPGTKKLPKRRPKSEFVHQFLVALTGTDPLAWRSPATRHISSH